MHQILLLLVGVLSRTVECQLCNKCPNGERGLVKDSIVKSLCSNTSGAALNHHCCVLNDNVIG